MLVHQPEDLVDDLVEEPSHLGSVDHNPVGAAAGILREPALGLVVEHVVELGRQTEVRASFEPWCPRHGVDVDLRRDLPRLPLVDEVEEQVLGPFPDQRDGGCPQPLRKHVRDEGPVDVLRA